MTAVLLEVSKDVCALNCEEAGALRFRPQGRSLDKGIHLATSDTKLSLPEERRSRTSPVAKREGQIRLQGTLFTSLRIIAFRDHETDMRDAWEGRRQGETGPWRASSDLRRLMQCQKEWRGFKPTCCASSAVAVPISCHHRLCPLCAAQRLERYRGPVREMLAAMEHPSFLTLTIPNCARLRGGTFKQIRNWWKAFYRANAAFLRGGVYAIEVTFNRLTRTWHPHLHLIFDCPYKLSGLNRATFTEAKLRLEFSWLRITSSSALRTFKKSEFAQWRIEAFKQPKGSAWNKTYRRVLDIRAVKQGDGGGRVHQVHHEDDTVSGHTRGRGRVPHRSSGREGYAIIRNLLQLEA